MPPPRVPTTPPGSPKGAAPGPPQSKKRPRPPSPSKKKKKRPSASDDRQKRRREADEERAAQLQAKLDAGESSAKARFLAARKKKQEFQDRARKRREASWSHWLVRVFITFKTFAFMLPITHVERSCEISYCMSFPISARRFLSAE